MATSLPVNFGLKIEGYVPQEMYERKAVNITLIEGVIENLATGVMIGLESLGYTGTVTAKSLADAMDTMFNLRIMQVSKMKPVAGFRPTDYKVWSMLFPVLAQIGIYRDEAAGLEIYPAYVGDPVTVEDIDRMNLVVASLAYWGMSYSMGLPKDTIIESDDIYRLSVRADTVLGSKAVPAPVSVMARLFFEIEALSSIYGENRVAYTTIRYLQQVFVDVAQGQLKNPSSIKV